MKGWLHIAGPYAVAAALIVAPLAWPGDSAFADWLALFPYGLAFAAVGLGLGFAQSRVAFCSIAILWSHTLAKRGMPAQGGEENMTVFASAMLLPWLLLAFCHARERGVFNRHGALRGGITALAGGLVAAFGHADPETWPAWIPKAALSEPVSATWALPPAAIVSFVTAFLLMHFRRTGDRSASGRFFAAALLPLFCGLNARSDLWSAPAHATLPPAGVSGALLLLVWAVLEHAWRNANLDELTGLPNRRALHRQLATLGGRYALAVLDLDRFKRVNDRFGHDAGDQALRFVARQIEKAKGGKAFRFGGEEFVLVYERKETERVVADLEAIRCRIREKPFAIRASNRPKRKPVRARKRRALSRKPRTIRLSVSIGLALPTKKNGRPDRVLHAADQALYAAKRGGRNRLCVNG